MEEKGVGVVVLNYNDYGNTIRYINEIKKYKCIDKIVIVDNSRDKTRYVELENLKDDKIDVINIKKNEGYAKGNNIGIRHLVQNNQSIKYIAISNPDVEVSEESYEKCLEFIEKENNGKVAMVAPRMYDINGNPHCLSGWKLRTIVGDTMDSSVIVTRKINKPHIERYGEYLDNHNEVLVDCLAGSFFIIKKEIFKSLNYFDENTFLYYEEDILGKRLHDLGYCGAVLNTCKFMHYEAVSVQSSMRYLRKYKIMQKSKRYYHKVYNKETIKNLFLLDLTTALGIIEIHYMNTNIIKRIYRKIKKRMTLEQADKYILYLYTYITLPFYRLIRIFRKKKRICYFSLVTWKWIKQRPHFIPYKIAKLTNNEVDYRYQTLRDEFVEDQKLDLVNNDIDNKYLKIKPFKIYPATEEYVLRDRLSNLRRTTMWNYDVIIITQPNQLDFFIINLFRIKKTKIIYECMDNYEEWEMDKKRYLEKEAELIDFSSHIIVSSQSLKNRLIKLYNIDENKISIVRNAYDKTLFESYRKDEGTILEHPNITYIGTIDDWFDFNSICEYARKNENRKIYLIGPVSHLIDKTVNKIKKEHSNIIFLGSIEHDLVPNYISESDLLIMSFILNNITKYVDPVKLYEYLYFKKPVVSTYWDELEQFKNIMYFYDINKNDFEEVVNKALKDGFIENEKDYKEVILDANWDNRVKEYIKHI